MPPPPSPSPRCLLPQAARNAYATLMPLALPAPPVHGAYQQPGADMGAFTGAGGPSQPGGQHFGGGGYGGGLPHGYGQF